MSTQAKPRIQSIYESRDEAGVSIGAHIEGTEQYTKRSLRIKNFRSGALVPQRHNGLIAAAESGDMLKPAIRLFQQHDWTVAENGVSIFRHVPRAT